MADAVALDGLLGDEVDADVLFAHLRVLAEEVEDELGSGRIGRTGADGQPVRQVGTLAGLTGRGGRVDAGMDGGLNVGLRGGRRLGHEGLQKKRNRESASPHAGSRRRLPDRG